jgi:hypothetical protein
MFTAIYVMVLGYITWMYFGEFIHCSQPNVYESSVNELFKEDDPDNDMTALFPVISFLDYSQPRPWPKGLPAIPFSDITCNFRVEFGQSTSNAWLFLPVTTIPLNGDCNAKFKEMYKKKTGKDDETISNTHYLICPDTEKLPLVGDGTECQGSGPCKYYSFMIFKRFGSTAHCNPINYNRIEFLVSYINPKLTVDDFDNPWSYRLDNVPGSFSQSQTQIMIINHFFTTLETDSRNFGLKSQTNKEKKLVQSPVVYIDKSPYLNSDDYPFLWIMWDPQAKSREVSRSYISFLDAAGSVGG